MALNDIIRSGIAIAHTQTLGVQCSITHEAWISQDAAGTPQYASASTLLAIVDLKRKDKTTADGRVVTTIAQVIILQVLTPNGASGRQEPIDPRDRITLPGGVTGPILIVPDAVLDPATNRPFFNNVYLGET